MLVIFAFGISIKTLGFFYLFFKFVVCVQCAFAQRKKADSQLLDKTGHTSMQAVVTIKNRFVHGLFNVSHLTPSHRGSLYSVYLGLALTISSRDFLIDKSRQETTHWCKTFICANAISRVWKDNSLLFVLLSLSRFFLIHICCQSEILPTVFLLLVLQCNDLSIYSWHVRFFSPPPKLLHMTKV